MTSLKTSIKTITYLSDIGCLEIQGASLGSLYACLKSHFSCISDTLVPTTIWYTPLCRIHQVMTRRLSLYAHE
ncbi:hypothetical protein DMR35_26820 [Klebsiella variicola]|uniref:Nitrite extrusion protein 2 n=2 Tax=Klebsiella TaxID=570 RepID=A0A285B8W9_9ENTR|nr:hypothetical protein BWI76_03285 [Klebsiella sp. M5al]PLO61681.1 hypothetical protein CWN49_32945 [Klebsiella michiganensis]PXJ92057.1 hypothetical protein DMR35_26820 [Klebsiella variicola]SNU37288.1 hypothetical protein KOSB73_340005 [Klebsiella grimontii]